MPFAVLCLGLLDQLLFAPVLALSLGLLRSGVQGGLMPETVDHAGGEGGITQNLKTLPISISSWIRPSRNASPVGSFPALTLTP